MPDLHLGIVSSDFGAGGLRRTAATASGDAGPLPLPRRLRTARGRPDLPQRRQPGPGQLQRPAGRTPSPAWPTWASRAAATSTSCSRCAWPSRPTTPSCRPSCAPTPAWPSSSSATRTTARGPRFRAVPRADRPAEEPSLRCATAGHLLRRSRRAGQRRLPRAAGQLRARRARRRRAARRQRLINVSEFVRHVQALKPGRPDRIIVSGVIGWRDDPCRPAYAVERGATRPGPSCGPGSGLQHRAPASPRPRSASRRSSTPSAPAAAGTASAAPICGRPCSRSAGPS